MKKLLYCGVSLLMIAATFTGIGNVKGFAEETKEPVEPEKPVLASLKEDVKVDSEIVLTSTPFEIGSVKSKNFILMSEISAFNAFADNFYTAADGTQIDTVDKLASYVVDGSETQVFGEAASDTLDKTIKATGYYVFELADVTEGKPGLKLCMMKAEEAGQSVHFELREVTTDGGETVVGFSDKVELAVGNAYAKGSGYEIYDGNFYVDGNLVNFYEYNGKVLKAKAPKKDLFKNSYDKLTSEEYKVKLSIETNTKKDGTTKSDVTKAYAQVRALRVPNKNVEVLDVITDKATNYHLTVVFDLTGGPYTNTTKNPNHIHTEAVLNKLWTQRGNKKIRENIYYNGESTLNEVSDAKRSADIHQRSGQMDFMKIIEAADTPYVIGDTILLKKGMPFSAGYGLAFGIDATSKSEYVGALTGDTIGKDTLFKLSEDGSWRQVVKVEGVSFKEVEKSISLGKNVAIVPEFTPANAFDKSFTAVSSNPEIVAVEGEIMKGLKTGTAKITVTTTDGNFTAELNVIVEDSVKKIEIKDKDNIKKEYDFGTEIELSNLKLNVTYASGKIEEVNVTKDMISGFNNKVDGEQTVVITYKGKRTSFSVKVLPEVKEEIKEDKKGGCGSIITTGSIAGALIILGISTVVINKKKED